ncbi:unnamed protein product [Agarophyton chilense]
MTRPLVAATATATTATTTRPDPRSRQLPTRNALHLTRKIFHVLSGLAYALFTRNVAPSTRAPLLFSLVFVVLVVELSRIRAPHAALNRAVLSCFRPFMRRHEARLFSGMLYYTLGVALVASYSRVTAACVAILSLAVADPVAALVGVAFEPALPEARLRNGKSVAGFIFGAFAAIFTAFTVLTCAVRSTMDLREALLVAVPVGISAAITELLIPSPQLTLPFRHVPLGLDDNLFIPLVAAFVCQYLLDSRLHDVHLSPLLLCKPFTKF